MNQSTTNEINEQLSHILNAMNDEYSLVDLCEYISNETKDKFTLEYFREVIEQLYPLLPKEDKIFLFKNLNLQSLGLQYPPFLLYLPYLFNNLEYILQSKIYAPTLILYYIADTIEHKLKITTLEFIYSIGLTVESVINVNEFFKKISTALQLEDIISVMIFKGLDYNHKGKIRIEDFLLVIDSYREDLIENEIIQINPDDYNKAMIHLLFVKHYMTIDELYYDTQYNYLDNAQLKTMLNEEFCNEINAEAIIDYFLFKVDKNKKIFKDDVVDYISLGTTTTTIINDNASSNNVNGKTSIDEISLIKPQKYVKLTEFQNYWINKYLNLIACVNITSKMAFEFAMNKNTIVNSNKDDSKSNDNMINLEELKRKMKILLPTGSFTTIEMNNMGEAFNINKNHFLDYFQYDLLINSLKYENQLESLGLTKTNTLILNPNQTLTQKPKASLYNTWIKGIKSTNYHLLPVKGNGTVLSILKKELRHDLQLQLSERNTKEPTSTNNNNQSINFIPTKSILISQGNKFFIQEDPIMANQSNNNLFLTNSKSQLRAKVNATRMQIDAPISTFYNEYNDDFDIIQALESFPIDKTYFPSYDLCNWLILNYSFAKEKAARIIRIIDQDSDGFISLMDIMNYLLHYLKQRSTKILLKFLYYKIYDDLRMTTKDYFLKNSIDPQKEINSIELSNYLLEFNVNKIITKKLYDEMIVTFPYPLQYKHFAILIDAQVLKLYTDTNKDIINDDNNNVFPKHIINKEYEREIREIVNEICGEDVDYINSEILKAKSLRVNLAKIFNDYSKVMNYLQFQLFFMKPLEINHNVGMYIFQLLQILSPNGEQVLDQNELCLFLESYIHINDDIITWDNNNLSIEDIIKNIEENGPIIQKALEHISFNPSGKIPICNIMSSLVSFYPTQSKNNLIKILKTIDTQNQGFVSYMDLQMFLYAYSTQYEKYSSDIEIKLLAANLCEEDNNIISSRNYFCSEKYKRMIKDYNNITQQEHNKILFSDLGSSKANKQYLYDYLCRRQGSNHGYSIALLCDLIDLYINSREIIVKGSTRLYERLINSLPIAIPTSASMSFIEQEQKHKNNHSTFKYKEKSMLKFISQSKTNEQLPLKNDIEEVLREFQLGFNGKISIIDFIRRFNSNTCNRRALSNILDIHQYGYIDYGDLINNLRNAYGNNINLNIKLSAKYMFIEFIKKWNAIESWVLSIAKTKDIHQMLSHDSLYSLFIFGFGYDKILFETFYYIHREKKGDSNGLFSLATLVKFIQENNKESKPEINKTFNQSKSVKSQYQIDYRNEGDDESLLDSNNDQIDNTPLMTPEETLKVLLIEYEKKTMPIKNIINNLNYNKMIFRSNCTIDEDYIKLFLSSNSIKMNNDLIILIISLFKYNDDDIENRFNLRSFCDFIRMYCPKSKCDILTDIIPKLKKQIQLCSIKNMKVFIQKYFQKDIVDITELASAIEFFKVSLYECIILTRSEDHISIEQLFIEYQLKDLFRSNNEIDTTLKTLLKNLSNYFEANKDKLKLFKKYDLDKNGFIAPDEFITALNSIKEITINDNQRMALLKIADKNRDGRINPKEFLMFIKSIKTSDDYQDDNKHSSYNNSYDFMPTNSGNNMPKVPMIFNQLYQQMIATTTAVQSNLEYNKKCHKENKDAFLAYLITLQQDYINSFSGIDSMEQDFLYADDKKIGYVSYEEFAVIVKKRVLIIDMKMIEKLIDFAHCFLGKKTMIRIINERKIKYMNFIQNVMNYRYEFTNEQEIVLEGDNENKDKNVRFGEDDNGDGESKGILPAVVLAGKKKTMKKTVTIKLAEKKEDELFVNGEKQKKDDLKPFDNNKDKYDKPLEILSEKIVDKELNDKLLPALSDQLISKKDQIFNEKPLPLFYDQILYKEEEEETETLKYNPLPLSNDLIIRNNTKEDEQLNNESSLPLLSNQIINERNNDRPIIQLSEIKSTEQPINNNNKSSEHSENNKTIKQPSGINYPPNDDKLIKSLINELQNQSQDKKDNKPLELLGSQLLNKEQVNIHQENEEKKKMVEKDESLKETQPQHELQEETKIIDKETNNEQIELLNNKLIHENNNTTIVLEEQPEEKDKSKEESLNSANQQIIYQNNAIDNNLLDKDIKQSKKDSNSFDNII